LANKEKLLASAQKFFSKGQIQKAIGEYQKLVNAFPKDVRTRQKLAELLCRDKRNEDALIEYEAVASHYTETGFYLKSIAVFKQMQKIEPSRVDIYHRLAELNEKQGLVGNALTEYRNLVAFYEKNQMYQEAIDVLEKMVALDLDNLNFSAKIAECLMASGRSEDAFERFQVIIEPLREKGEHLKVIKLYERFLDICPEEGTSRLPLAQALLKSGSVDKAIQTLKGLLKHSPEDPEISRSLADAYVTNQDFSNARLTLKHLLKQNGDDFDLREYYARICIDAGEVERARDRLEEWKDDFFQAERVNVLQGFYEELKDLLPGDSTVSETLSAIYEAIGDASRRDELDVSADVSVAIDVVTDAALLYGAIDDVESLDLVGEEAASDFEAPPLDVVESRGTRASEKKAAVGIELDLDLDLDLDLEAPGTLVEGATFPVETESEPEAVSDEEDVPASEVDEDVEIEIDLNDMDELDLDFDEEFAIEDELDDAEQAVVEDEKADAADEFVSEEEELEAEFEFAAEVTAADLDTAEGIDGSVEVGVEEAPAESEIFAQQEDVEEVDDLEDVEEVDGLEDVEELDGLEEVEEVETCVESEKLEIIEDLESLEDVEELEEIEELEDLEEVEVLEDVEELEALEDVEVLEDVEELEALEEVDASSYAPSAGLDFAAALNVDAELEEAEFYLQQGLYDDAERVVRTLMEYRPGLPVLQTKMDEISQSRQAAETESEGSGFIDIMSDLQDDDLIDATDFLGSFRAATQQGEDLSQKLVSELDSTDTESHYNIGIAYKEMGLYDDAIAEFEKAAKDPARNLDCTTLTGQCYVEAGDVDAAMATFKGGLINEGITDEGRMTLNFEVGMLHQMNGQLLEALEAFQLVAEKDSFFRDVSKLIKNLRRELGLDDDSDDGGPQGNRDRVSYV